MLMILSKVCVSLYLSIYAFEAPVRYGLFLVGKDWVILARDGLMILPVVLVSVSQMVRGRLDWSFVLFSGLIVFHGLVLVGTVGSVVGAAYGAKLLINLLTGFLLASQLVAPKRWMLRLFAVLWCVTIAGAVADKVGVPFPWIGIETVIGNLTVDVSKDWSIQDPFSRRVAGFTRSSISAAGFIPLLAIVLMGASRSLLMRTFMAVVSVGAVFLTTQKGALLAFVPVVGLLWLELPARALMLRIGALVFMLACVAVPFLTVGLYLPHSAGVFSLSSFAMRISDTWPQALVWIQHQQLLVFGVGLGGLGGAQRLYAPDYFNPADNMFLLLYAFFGVFAILYLAVLAWRIAQPARGERALLVPSLGLLMFLLGDGAVISIIEDQAAALFFGAAVGGLWLATGQGASARSGLAAVGPRWRRLTRIAPIKPASVA